MDVMLILETMAFSIFAFICRPVTWILDAWGDRLERKAEAGMNEYVRSNYEIIDDDATKPGCGMMQTFPGEPTVSHIHPRGAVKVHAMGPGGKWEDLPDYPVRLLPKQFVIVNEKGERVR